MRRLALLLSAAVFSISAGSVHAQGVISAPTSGPHRASDYYAAPGLYGTSYGYASYGIPRTHSNFSAKPWSSYYANYPPYSYLPGRFGVEMWQPGGSTPGSIYGVPTSRDSYRTFPVTAGTGLTADQIAPPPPIGVYAPALGPGGGFLGE